MPADPARVKEVFLAAAALPPADRPGFLAAACGTDPDVRTAVDRLLAAHDRPNSLLDRPGMIDATDLETHRADGGGSPADVAANLTPSREPGSIGRLDHYEVMEVVGRGGMGVVLKGRDTKLQRVVAVKLLDPALAACGTARQRFVREAQAAAAIRDEHVVAVHAVEGEGPTPYLVMEFVSGVTLEDKIRVGGPVEAKEVLRVGLQAARGLAAAHAQGLVHRDVKPANILLENGVQRVKLTDFGLARAAADASLTRSGVIAGTPLYMSPEQARGESVDHRSDLFSLGSVLYTLCAGRPAFRAETITGIIRRVCEDTPRPIREINPDIPEGVCRVIARLMAKAPADRFQSANEVADLLAGYLAHLQQPDRVPPPAEMPAARRGRQWRPLATAVGAGLLAGAVAVYLVLSHPGPPTPPADAGAGGGSKAGPANPAPAEWRPRSPRTAAELAKLASPFDGRSRADVPPALLTLAGNGDAAAAPAELVAVFGGGPFVLPGAGPTLWPTQTRDGRLLAVPQGNEVAVFDARTGALLRVLSGHTERVGGAAFSPDGRRLAAGCRGAAGPVRVWEVKTGRQVLALQGPEERVHEIAFSPDGRQVAAACWDQAVRVWDAASGEPVRRLTGPDGPVYSVAYEPEGRWLAATAADGRVWVWNAATGATLKELSGLPPGPWRVAVSPDGKWLAAGTRKGTTVWATATWEVQRTLASPGEWVAFSPDSRTLLAARHDCRDADSVVACVDPATGAPLRTLVTSRRRGFTTYHLSPDGKTLYSMGSDHPPEGALQAFEVDSGQEALPGPVSCVALSPDGRTLAGAGPAGAIWLWELSGRGKAQPPPPARRLHGPGSEVRFVAFSPDGRTLAAAGPAAGVTLWDVAGGRQLGQRIAACIDCTVAFSPDGATLAVPQADGSVELHDIASGTAREPFRLHSGAAQAVAFSPDGRWLATSGADRAVLLADVQTGRRRTLSRAVACPGLAFSPDGTTLFGTTSLPDGRLRRWNAATGAEVEFRNEPTDRAGGLAIHPGGQTAATIGLDGSVRVWELASAGVKVWRCPIHAGGVRQTVAFTPEGRFLAVVNRSGAVLVLRVPSLPDDAGRPPSLPDPAVLARRPAPADALNPAGIPAALAPAVAPRELVAVLGGADEHQGQQVSGVAVSANGRHLASAGANGSVCLWDLANGKFVHSASREGHHAFRVVFAPSGRWIAGWREDGTIGIHDSEAEGGWRALAIHGPQLAALAVSPSGAVLASGGRGGQVRLWDLTAGPRPGAALRRILPANPGYAWCLAFSADGRALAVGGDKGLVRVYEVESGWEVGQFHFPRAGPVGRVPPGRPVPRRRRHVPEGRA